MPKLNGRLAVALLLACVTMPHRAFARFIDGYLAECSAVGTGTCTEVVGVNYPGRQPVSYNSPVLGSANLATSYTFGPLDTATIAGHAIYDAPTGGNLLLVMPLATPVVLSVPGDVGDSGSLGFTVTALLSRRTADSFSGSFSAAAAIGTTFDGSTVTSGVALTIYRGILAASSSGGGSSGGSSTIYTGVGPVTVTGTSIAVATNSANGLLLLDGSGLVPLARLPGIPLSALAQSGAASGQVIGWNGSAWAPSTPATGSGAGFTGTTAQLTDGAGNPVTLGSGVALNASTHTLTSTGGSGTTYTATAPLVVSGTNITASTGTTGGTLALGNAPAAAVAAALPSTTAGGLYGTAGTAGQTTPISLGTGLSLSGSVLNASGSGAAARTSQTITASATILATTNLAAVNRPSAAAITVTTPASPQDGADYTVADFDGLSSGTYTITIVAASGYTLTIYSGNNIISTPGSARKVNCSVALARCQITG